MAFTPVSETPTPVAAQFSFPEPKSALARDLFALIGGGKVCDGDEVRESHAVDKWYAKALPEVVVFAESTDDVVQVMRYAHEHRIPVTTRGAGYGYVGGCVPSFGGIVLSLIRMNRIVELNPEDGVAVVEPGVITVELQEAARALTALFEIWCDAQLRARIGSGVVRWSSHSLWRTSTQKQNRLRLGRTLYRFRRDAGHRHPSDLAPHSQAAFACDVSGDFS